MWWMTTAASATTRWLLNAAWAFIWTVGYGALTLVPLGVHGYRWWLAIIGFALLVGLAVGGLSAVLNRRFVASYAAVLEGLTADQRRQVTRIWRRGPVPADPMVLTAALRLHDLVERYRRDNQSRRKSGLVLVVISMVLLVVSTIGAHQQVPATALGSLAIGVFLVAAPTATALRARRLQPRLAQLRAAAQADPQVAAAVASPAERAAPFSRRERLSWAAAALVIAVLAVAALAIAESISPHRTACRAVSAVASENYQDRYFVLADDEVGPGGPPLSKYQQWAESMRRHATEADDDPAVAPHLDRIADLAAHAVSVVEQARQPGSVTPLAADSQSTYLGTVSQLVAEEGPAQELCRR